MSQTFEASKKRFIDSVVESYKNFLKENGLDLEKEIRKKLINERRLRKEEKLRLNELELICNELFTLEYDVYDKIQEYYGDINDIDLESEWYISEGMVFIKFTWNDYEMILSNLNDKPKLKGGPKFIRKYLKTYKGLSKIVDLDKRYYLIDEGFVSKVKK